MRIMRSKRMEDKKEEENKTNILVYVGGNGAKLR